MAQRVVVLTEQGSLGLMLLDPVMRVLDVSSLKKTQVLPGTIPGPETLSSVTAMFQVFRNFDQRDGVGRMQTEQTFQASAFPVGKLLA